VENAAIASKVFGGYLICMADGPGLQHVGFAVRPKLAHRCGPVVESLALDGRGRKAISMRLTPARSAPIELLAVHLKSGCSHDPLDSANAACQLLAKQATKLGEWIEERSARNMPFIVLGDFNRVPPQSADDPFWQRVLTAPVELLATRLSFDNCFVGQPFSQYIDQILLSNSLRDRLIPASPRHSHYRSADVVRYQLSDHCPVSISLAMPD
jgi:endonuclease/exonuclease/phosphatase family metal-dependent hydrolase